MKVECLTVGPLHTNCYILNFNGETLIIDPGDEALRIIDLIEKRKIIGIIITHYHFDHIGALNYIKTKFACKVYDIYNLKNGINILGSFRFQVIFTPGHKDDAISIYFPQEKAFFSGDFIFSDTIGRCDLEGGNFKQMQASIKKVIDFPPDVIIYPGHGPMTSFQKEKENLEYWLDIKSE